MFFNEDIEKIFNKLESNKNGLNYDVVEKRLKTIVEIALVM